MKRENEYRFIDTMIINFHNIITLSKDKIVIYKTDCNLCHLELLFAINQQYYNNARKHMSSLSSTIIYCKRLMDCTKLRNLQFCDREAKQTQE